MTSKGVALASASASPCPCRRDKLEQHDAVWRQEGRAPLDSTDDMQGTRIERIEETKKVKKNAPAISLGGMSRAKAENGTLDTKEEARARTYGANVGHDRIPSPEPLQDQRKCPVQRPTVVISTKQQEHPFSENEPYLWRYPKSPPLPSPFQLAGRQRQAAEVACP